MSTENQIILTPEEEDSAIRAIFELTSSDTGEKFFLSLVKNLCGVLGTCGAWVTEYSEGADRIKALSFWLNNQWLHNFSYSIYGTPCETVLKNTQFVHIKDRLLDSYPGESQLKPHGIVSYMGAPLLDSEGKVIGLLAAVDNKPLPDKPQSIALFKIFAARTAAELRRLQAENKIREREAKLSGLINAAMDGIVELDSKLSVTLLNPAAEKLFKCSKSELVGNSFLDMLEDKGKRIILSTIQELNNKPEGQRSVWITESLNLNCKEGIKFPAEATISRYELNKETFYSIILRNINDKLEAEEKIHSLELEKEFLKEELKIFNSFEEIVGQSKPMINLLQEVSLVAGTSSTVLIYGETGTGKELIARAIHSASRRKDKPLITVNCASIPASLIESEFFGHVKGAFTGATEKRIGRFELANEGTIFLDEIGELHFELQAKLLRILQEGEFEPVGSSGTKKINVRIIAATNRNLEQEVKNGKFREDLYYRLNVYPLKVPPLRERDADIILLSKFFAEKSARKLGKEKVWFNSESVEILNSYSWPGNIRELQNIIERAVITSANGKLNFRNLLPGTTEEVRNSNAAKIYGDILSQKDILEIERKNILKALQQTGWKISGKDGAANLLAIPPTTLSSKIKAFGIKKSAINL